MNRLKEFKNYKPSITKNIMIDGTKYNVCIQGSGSVNVLCVGGATLCTRTLSEKFKQITRFYACDLYWPAKFKINNSTTLTIDKIVDDIFSVLDQIEVSEVILFGHSAYGILALEAAKRRDTRIKAVIMVGTPTESNQEIAKTNNKYFEEHATLKRQENDRLRKEYYARIRKSTDSEVSLNAYESFSARYWFDYNITREFLEELWQDVEIDDGLCNHFFNFLLPSHITSTDIEKIDIPVILLAGQYDYDCVPLELWKNYPQPANFTVIDCENTGHWPMIENPEAFDSAIGVFIKKIDK
jgi:proline iminopeptidase